MARKTRNKGQWAIALWVAVVMPAGPVTADDDPPRHQREDCPARHEDRGDGERSHRGRHGPGFRHGYGLGRDLFRLEPEDRGPLRAGEEAELLAFAEEHMPRVHRLMQRLQSRDPARFRAKLEEHAPRIRHMRRVFSESPQLGQIIREHAEVHFRLRIGARQYRRARFDTERQQSIRKELRKTLEGAVELEVRALNTLANELERQQDEKTQRRLEYAVSDDADLSRVPEPVQALAERARSTGPEGAAARDELEKVIRRQITGEIERLRHQAKQIESNVDEYVDKRMERLLERVGRRGRPGPSGRGRHGPGFRNTPE